MHLLTVGEMARLNHVSEQTLRLYDREGLLCPCVRKENGYRYYDIKQSVELDVIQYMKSLGISLKEIRQQLKTRDIEGVERALRDRDRQLMEEMRALQCRRSAVRRTLESLAFYRSAPPDGVLQLEYMPARQAYVLDTGVNFYEHDLDTYESLLRQLKKGLLEDDLPQIYFCNAGTVLRRTYLDKRLFYSTEVFVFVNPEFVSSELITIFPAASYACIYCDDFYKEKDYAHRLLEYIEAQHYIISGDYLCEVITDMHISLPDERKMFLRLQVPIEFCTKRL